MRPLAAAALSLVGSTALAQVPQGAAASRAATVVQQLRPAIRVVGQPDSAFSIEERMRYWHVPGVSIAIVDSFRVVYAQGFGVAEFGGATPVDTTTLFQAGSISKPVFATAALALVGQGKLALDEDVNATLRSWRLPENRFTEREKVTLRRLLTHTAGLTVWGFPGYASGHPVPTVPQVLDGAAPANTAQVRNDTIPGARWLYSGGGYTIGQLLATDATGEPFPALMQRLVLRPSGMMRSTFENPLPVARHREAASGHERIDTPITGRFHTYPEMAAAGLWTTAPELARWALAITRAFHGERGGAISPEMARQMLAKQVSTGPPGGDETFGLGPILSGEGDSLAFGHRGRDAGFIATMMMWPALGRGFVVLTNGVSRPFLGDVHRAFNEAYGITSAPRQERGIVAVDPDSLAPLVGRYAVDTSAVAVLEVTARDGQLWMYTHLDQRLVHLRPEGGDVFYDMHSGNSFTFERDGTKPAPAVRYGNVRAPRLP